MKVLVTEIYQDKTTGEHHYIGEELEIKDSKRVDELVASKVVKVAELPKPKKSAAKE